MPKKAVAVAQSPSAPVAQLEVIPGGPPSALDALRASAKIREKTSKSDVPVVQPPAELLTVVDTFIARHKAIKELEVDRDRDREQILRFAIERIADESRAARSLLSSVKLTSSGPDRVLVSEQEKYSPIDEKVLPTVHQLLGGFFPSLCRNQLGIVVSPKVTQDERFLLALAELSAKFPGYFEISEAVVPAPPFHVARVFEPQVAQHRDELRKLKVWPVTQVKVVRS